MQVEADSLEAYGELSRRGTSKPEVAELFKARDPRRENDRLDEGADVVCEYVGSGNFAHATSNPFPMGSFSHRICDEIRHDSIRPRIRAARIPAGQSTFTG